MLNEHFPPEKSFLLDLHEKFPSPWKTKTWAPGRWCFYEFAAAIADPLHFKDEVPAALEADAWLQAKWASGKDQMWHTNWGGSRYSRYPGSCSPNWGGSTCPFGQGTRRAFSIYEPAYKSCSQPALKSSSRGFSKLVQLPSWAHLVKFAIHEWGVARLNLNQLAVTDQWAFDSVTHFGAGWAGRFQSSVPISKKKSCNAWCTSSHFSPFFFSQAW